MIKKIRSQVETVRCVDGICSKQKLLYGNVSGALFLYLAAVRNKVLRKALGISN